MPSLSVSALLVYQIPGGGGLKGPPPVLQKRKRPGGIRLKSRQGITNGNLLTSEISEIFGNMRLNSLKMTSRLVTDNF